MIIDEEVYLEHFGIKGMHWGVRRDLQKNERRQAKRIANAQKYLAKADVLSTKISQLENKQVNPYSYRGQQTALKLDELRIKRRTAIEDAERKSQGKLSQAQRRMVAGGVILGGIVAVAGAYTMVQSGQARRLGTKVTDLFKDKHNPGWKLDRKLADPNLTVDAIHADVVSKINPKYGLPGTKMNCRRATFAYEMRRRGFDVEATRTSNGYGQNVAGQFNVLNPGKDYPTGRIGVARTVAVEKYKLSKGIATDAHISTLVSEGKTIGENNLNPSSIFHDLGQLPDGARGELGMQWGTGGGHSMAFEIVKGKPVIFDTQNGKVYKNTAQFREIADSMANAGYTRLDNKTLDTNFIMKWVKNAG